jgi:hypothetical protein
MGIEMQKLTRRQAAIIGAFTGVTCGPFADIQDYVDSLPGFEGIGTLSFGSKEVAEQIREASRADFIAICAERESSTLSQTMEAT